MEKQIYKNELDRPTFYQTCPFFFTPEGATLSLVGLYRGATAFLIGGGPSFALIDRAKLSHVWTMTLNNATASYRGNANCLVDDPSRFSYSMWLDPTIQKFVPLSAFEEPLWDNRLLPCDGGFEQHWGRADLKVRDCPNVVGYRRNEKFHAPSFLYEESINWGCSKQYGGGRSVMLPALRILFLLGFRKVYLLGVDFEMSHQKKYHFPEDRPYGAIRGNMQTYGKLERWFSELQPYFLAENFVVQNCNPESKLTVFPFISFSEALAEASLSLGNYAQEQTRGMYRSLEQKEAFLKLQKEGSSIPMSDSSDSEFSQECCRVE